MLFTTVGAVLLTTQKGARGRHRRGHADPGGARPHALSAAVLGGLGFAILDVALPIFTAGLLMPENGGVFSFASFAMRITGTWPDAWRWINDNNLFPFGVGLGGIGGAQRFYAQDFFNPSDNLFIFIYANFGVLSLFYLGWAVWQGLRQPPDTRVVAITPLAILVFNLGYGAALSMLEDQVSQLYLRRIRRNAVDAAADGRCETVGQPIPRRADPLWRASADLQSEAARACGGVAMKIRAEDETNNFTLLRLLLSLAVVLGHFKLLSGTAVSAFSVQPGGCGGGLLLRGQRLPDRAELRPHPGLVVVLRPPVLPPVSDVRLHRADPGRHHAGIAAGRAVQRAACDAALSRRQPHLRQFPAI